MHVCVCVCVSGTLTDTDVLDAPGVGRLEVEEHKEEQVAIDETCLQHKPEDPTRHRHPGLGGILDQYLTLGRPQDLCVCVRVWACVCVCVWAHVCD